LPGLAEPDSDRKVTKERGRYVVTSKGWREDHDSSSEETTFDSETWTIEVETDHGYVTGISGQADDLDEKWQFSKFGEDVPAITPPPDELIDEDVSVAELCGENDPEFAEPKLGSPTVVACTPRGNDELPEPEGSTDSSMQFRRLEGSVAECQRRKGNPPSEESAALRDSGGSCHRVGPTVLDVQRADIQVLLESPETASLRVILGPEDRRRLRTLAHANRGRQMGVVMFGVVLAEGEMYDSDYGGEVFLTADLPLASRVYAALVE
jgi:hypothetical protein